MSTEQRKFLFATFWRSKPGRPFRSCFFHFSEDAKAVWLLPTKKSKLWKNSPFITLTNNYEHVYYDCLLRWSTSALRMPKDTPNSKPYSEFLNLTPNSKTSLRNLEPHSKFQNLTSNSKTSLRIQKNLLRIKKPHSEFKNLTPNSWTSLQIPKSHSECKSITPNSKNLTPNSWTSLRLRVK